MIATVTCGIGDEAEIVGACVGSGGSVPDELD